MGLLSSRKNKFFLNFCEFLLLLKTEDKMAEFLTEKQKEDLAFFYGRFDELLANQLYKHKFVLIHNKNISGVFDTFENALSDAVSKFQPGDYIIQQIISETETSGFLYSAYAPV